MLPGEQGSPTRHGVLVGLDDIYRLLLALQNKQSEMDGKMGAYVTATASSQELFAKELHRVTDDHKSDHDDHETRIRALERQPIVSPKAVWSAVGILITAIGVATAIISLITQP